MFGSLGKKLMRLLGVLGAVGVLSITAVRSQDSAARTLQPNAGLTGTLTADSRAQVYTFEGAAGQSVRFAIEGQGGLSVVLMLTNARGELLAQYVDDQPASPLTTPAFSLPAAGTYYVTVFAADNTAAGGSFQLSLISEAVPATPTAAAQVTSSAGVQPGQVLTISGLQVTLSWNTAADMNLQVRDPVGDTLFWDSRTTPGGGSFGFDANGLCEVISEQPLETASWPSGAIPTGSYEILVYYRQSCQNSGSTSFTVNVTVDGVALDPVEGTLEPPAGGAESVFITRFVVGADGNAVAGPSGVYTDVSALPAAFNEIQSRQQPITRDVPVQGVITNAQPYAAYSFEAAANELISISMQKISASLDPLVLLVDSSGRLVDFSDDIASDNRDSLISNRRLLVGGTYTIVATRYGKLIGGTEGAFTLTLTGLTGDLPKEVLDLNLPRGDIEISLVWNTGADLQLLVRDPAGDSVFDDTPVVPSGGRLASNGNVNCVRAQTTNPVSYIYWPQGFARPGSYEVEVWYQNVCNETTPPEFLLNIVVNGQPVFSDTVRPVPNQRYITSFTLDVNGQIQAGLGGFLGGSETLDYRSKVASAPRLINGQPVSGNITPDNKFDVYVFDGESGDVVTISMQAVAGTLDTTLFLIGPTGVELAANDDAVVGETTDSLISQFTLPQDGQYVVIATHFGTVYGGTTGTYNLTLRSN